MAVQIGHITGANYKLAGGASYLYPGEIIGGTPAIRAGWKTFPGSGGVELHRAMDWESKPNLKVNFTDSTKALLQKAIRSAYPYPTDCTEFDNLVLQFWTDSNIGYTVGTDTSGQKKCAVDRFAVSWKEDGVVTADFDFVGLTATPLTTPPTMATKPVGDTLYAQGDVVVTLAGNDRYCYGFDLEHANGRKARAPGTTRSSNAKRAKTHLELGPASNKLSMEVALPLGYDLTADAQSHTIGAVITLANGTTTTTFTYTNLGLEGEPIELRPTEDGEIVYKLEFHCGQDCLAIT